MREIWEEIPGYDGYYEVSNLGRVRSWKKGTGHPGRIEEPRIMKQSVSVRGYYVLNLCKDGKRKICKVHILVANAFIPNPENKPQVNHKDGNKLNNRIDNLERVTNFENATHAHETGLVCNKGEDHGFSKLTEEDVIRMRQLYSEGELQKDLAKIFNISAGHVSYVVNRKGWTHI